MTILLWTMLGLTAGWIASIILKTHITQGMVTDIILGIVGAFFGGLLLSIVGQPAFNNFDISEVIIILLGSAALIWFGRMINAPAR